MQTALVRSHVEASAESTLPLHRFFPVLFLLFGHFLFEALLESRVIAVADDRVHGIFTRIYSACICVCFAVHTSR